MPSLLHSLSPLALRLPGAFSLASMHGAWLQRRALSKLDGARLSDLGITEREAAREASRPFWDVPAGWRR
ncbi:DUF1127 domain-containing protein [Pseudoroseicyclus sp. CXY001]|uniref:DUF1127 domain-containing protein n=1 Tax=Pseudoroseicyclus sp. CXY001 TaxID=3242492 RepID=UPI003570E0CA